MLWFALGVIAIAGITLVFLRLWTMQEPGDPFRDLRGPHLPRGRRSVAPDDDEEFLRSLSRHRED